MCYGSCVFIPLLLWTKMLHDPEGTPLHPHALLGLRGEGGCTRKLLLRWGTPLAVTVVALCQPSRVGQRCGVGSGHPRCKVENTRLVSSPPGDGAAGEMQGMLMAALIQAESGHAGVLSLGFLKMRILAARGRPQSDNLLQFPPRRHEAHTASCSPCS